MNEKYFKKEFAYMFVRPKQWASYVFELETPEGWNNLLFNLFTIISIIDTGKHVRLEQVKSKLAGLRFYFEWTGPERRRTLHDLYVDVVNKFPWQVKRLLGYPCKKMDSTHEQIYDIVSLFEHVSLKVCEDCGEPASLRNNGHWLYTLCDKCWNKHKITKISEEITNNERLIVSGHLQPEDVRKSLSE